MSKLAVVGCSQLVTLAGPTRPRTGGEMRELAIIADGAMLIADGRIESVGTRSEIESAMGGNVCRCGTYNRISLAVRQASRNLK